MDLMYAKAIVEIRLQSFVVEVGTSRYMPSEGRERERGRYQLSEERGGKRGIEREERREKREQQASREVFEESKRETTQIT
jgi:hypothetical protein